MMTAPRPVSARRSRKRAIAPGVWLVWRHMRVLWLKISIERRRSASARSTAVSIPPVLDTCAPSSIGEQSRWLPAELVTPTGRINGHVRATGESQVSALSDRAAARRQCPHRALQLALRPAYRRVAGAPVRGYRPRPFHRRGGRSGAAGAGVAGHRLGRGADPPDRAPARLRRDRRAAGVRGQRLPLLLHPPG